MPSLNLKLTNDIPFDNNDAEFHKYKIFHLQSKVPLQPIISLYFSQLFYLPAPTNKGLCKPKKFTMLKYIFYMFNMYSIYNKYI